MACQMAGLGMTTIRDSLGIAELKILDPEKYTALLNNMPAHAKMKEIEARCREVLRGKLIEIAQLQNLHQVLPFKCRPYRR